MQKMQETKDEVSLDARTFTVSKCPKKVFDEFVQFAKIETGNNYPMAIKILLERNAQRESIEKMVTQLQAAGKELSLEGMR